MKNTSTLLSRMVVLALCMVVCGLAQANPVRLSNARMLAQRYMVSNESPVLVDMKDGIKTGKRLVGGDLQQNIYLFSRGANKGFVVIAGNDELPQVIGYAEQGDYDYDNLPPALQDMLTFYAMAADSLNALDNSSSVLPLGGVSASSPRMAAGTRNITPLVPAHWNQGGPYNLRCPRITSNGNLALTGCVATATSQILYYWRRDMPEKTKNTTPTYGYGDAPVLTSNVIPSGTPLKWDLMRPSYGGSETDEMRDAVAVLMATVGMSSWLTYGSSTSGQISNASDVMKSQFGMTGNVVSWKSSYSQTAWEKLIIDDLENGYPILYSGVHPSSGGHAVVVDGYRVSDNLFHFNFGWGGQGDGYYTVNDETGMNGFNGSQGMAHKSHPSSTKVVGELLEAPTTMLCRTNNQVRVRITNKGTLPMSGIYVYLSTGKTPAGTSVSDKETIIGCDESAELTFQVRPAATNTYNIFVTDANKNILAEKLAVPTLKTDCRLTMKSLLCDDGVQTEQQTINGEQLTVHLINNSKKADLGVRLQNAEDATSCRPTLTAYYARYEEANGDFGTDTKKTKTDVVFEPGAEEDVMFSFTGLTDDVVYRFKFTLTAEGYNTSDRIEAEAKDTVLYFRMVGGDLTGETLADGRQVKLKGRYNSQLIAPFTADPNVTSYDVTELADLPNRLTAANPNALFYATAEQNVAGRNIVVDHVVEQLDLTPGYDFIPLSEMKAMNASYHIQEGVGEYGTAYLPFDCDVPTGLFARKINAVNLSTLKDVDSCNVALDSRVPYMIMSDKPRTLSAKNVDVSTEVTPSEASQAFLGTFVNIQGTSTNYMLDHEEKQYFESARNKTIPALTAYIEHNQHVNSISSQYRQKDNKSKELAQLLVEALSFEQSLPKAVYVNYKQQLDAAVEAGEQALTTQPVLEELTAVTAQLSELVKELRTKVVNVTPDGYVDCTNMIANPSFESGSASGWTRHNSAGSTTATDAKVVNITSSLANYMVGADGNIIMSLKKNAKVFQTIEGVPNGKYEMRLSVAADPGEKVTLFINDSETEVAGHAFGATYMQNVLFEADVTDGTITFGAVSNANWAKVDNFRLRRLATEDEITAIDVIAVDETSKTTSAKLGIFDLTGRKLSQTGKGIYIINGRKVVK